MHPRTLHPESKSLERFGPDYGFQRTGVDRPIVFRMQGRYRIGGSTVLRASEAVCTVP